MTANLRASRPRSDNKKKRTRRPPSKKDSQVLRHTGEGLGMRSKKRGSSDPLSKIESVVPAYEAIMIPPTRAKSANDSTIPGAAKLIPKTDGFLETARIALEQALP